MDAKEEKKEEYRQGQGSKGHAGKEEGRYDEGKEVKGEK